MTIFWFRRDLRLTDNAALYHALKEGGPVLPVFIFDKTILSQLEDPADKRVSFIYDHVLKLATSFHSHGSTLEIVHDEPLAAFKRLTEKHPLKKVYTNTDYEPYARERDLQIKAFLESRGVLFRSFKDQVIFEKREVVKDDQTPYTVFTPYSNRWKDSLNDFYLKSYPVEKYFPNFFKSAGAAFPSLEEMGFVRADYQVPPAKVVEDKLSDYGKTRDFPALDATSHLGVHLRFGTISIRKLAAIARKRNETFLNELIWREFFMMILWHFPHVAQHAFKAPYNHIQWRNREDEFAAWCAGKTGYPLVDAGMRQLNATGFMHNRVRMVTANFLVKLLLIDWRWGEAYFAQKLLDYELAANNGNWQWAAGSGCDAAPYFRIFNPQTQIERFDAGGEYIRQWIPEYGTKDYPPPLVDYKAARARALQIYAEAVKTPK